MHLLEGFAIGLGTLIFIGPVFFLLLNSSLQFGSKAGVLVSLGIFISDIICAILCYYGVAAVLISEKNKFWIGIVGCIILLVLGISYLLKKTEGVKENFHLEINFKSHGNFFLKGFSINFFNVFVFIYWTGMFQYGKLKYETDTAVIWFLASIILGILVIDLIKVLIAKKIRKLISQKFLSYVFRVTGVLLLVFAIRLLFWLFY